MGTNKKAKSVIDYYILNNRLKDVIRTGWKDWHVKRDRLESVAEHVFGTQTLAIAMHSQYQYDLDLEKVLYMLAIHELEETIIGDLTAWDISAKDKLERGHAAIKVVLKDLLNKDEIEALILEFDERKTKEAKFAYCIDKMECNIQCKLYDEQGCVDLENQDDNNTWKDPTVQHLLNAENKCWSNMWLEYHRSKFLDDDNFIEILDYIKMNHISD